LQDGARTMSFSSKEFIFPIQEPYLLASVVSLGNGTYLEVSVHFVASPDNAYSGFNTYLGQVFDGNGKAVGASAQLVPDNALGINQLGQYPLLVKTDAGSVKIVWVDGTTLQSVEFDPVTGTVSPIQYSFPGAQQIALSNSGLTLFLSKYDPVSNTTSPAAVAFDKNLNVLTEVVFVKPAFGTYTTQVGLGDGQVVVQSRIDNRLANLALDFYAKSAVGDVSKTSVDVASVAGLPANNPRWLSDVRLFDLANDKLAVMWFDSVGGNYGGKLFMRFYDSQGTALSAPLHLDAGFTYGTVYPRSEIHAVSVDDQFVFVSWIQESKLVGCYYGLDGKPAEDPFIIDNLREKYAYEDNAYRLISVSKGHLEVQIDHASLVAGTSRLIYKPYLHVIDLTQQTGTAKADHLQDTPYDDLIQGLGGNDVLSGKSGNDHLMGGAGDDLFSDVTGNNVFDGGTGHDVVSFKGSHSIVFALDHSLGATAVDAGDKFFAIEELIGSALGDDSLSGDKGDNTIRGLGGNDRLFGRGGNDILVGGAGSDLIDGGSGNDTVSYANSGSVKASLSHPLKDYGDAKGDRYVGIENLVGSIEGDSLEGNNSANNINGLAGHDDLNGAGGNDVLDGGTGDDRLIGGIGSDRLSGGAGSDELEGGAGADQLNGGTGRDTADYQHSKGVTVALDGSVAGKGDATGDTLAGIENLVGSSSGADVLIGDKNANDLYGDGGNDTLQGKSGNDYLVGGAGADMLDGGSGKDFASYFYGDSVSISLDGSLVATGDAVGDTLVSIEKLVGSRNGNDTLSGDTADNYIYGAGGNDQLDGRAGDDVLEGGQGKDILTGGGGIDNFYFDTMQSGGDIIKDFGSDDVIVVNGTNFGNRHGYYAFDENFVVIASGYPDGIVDGFVYRTSDHTLWYHDPDHPQSVMLAQFANNHVLTGYDIYFS
jgi:Ca2+-binding RTX toxin-like protein